jgi:hypothetical protein
VPLLEDPSMAVLLTPEELELVMRLRRENQRLTAEQPEGLAEELPESE